MAFKLNETNRQALHRFLERRNLKSRTIDLLGEVIHEHDLPRGTLTQDRNATYSKLVDDIESAISSGWLEEDQLASMLDEAEVAGRQHVCVFSFASKDADEILDALRDPARRSDDVPSLEDLWKVPKVSVARVLRDTRNEVLVKIVTRREYWQRELDPKSTSREEWIHRWIEIERSAVVVKCHKPTKRLQIRIPPRERSNQVESGKSVHKFLTEALEDHYSLDGDSWFSKLKVFPITDAYRTILENREDFVLRHDSPESDTAKSSLYTKGAVKELADLRDDPMWSYDDVEQYARKSMRGAWKIEEDGFIYAHFNFDIAEPDPKTKVKFARIFFPYLATDAEVDHAIQRISDHLP